MVVDRLDYRKIESSVDKFTNKDNGRLTMKKGIPRKDGSGGGIRLNKGRGGCPLSEQEVYGKGKRVVKELMSDYNRASKKKL